MSYTLLSNAYSTYNRVLKSRNAWLQFPDGTEVFVYTDYSGTAPYQMYVAQTSDHGATFTILAQYSVYNGTGYTFAYYSGNGPSQFALVPDKFNNFYLLGPDSVSNTSYVRVVPFTWSPSLRTWTAGTASSFLQYANNTIISIQGSWCDTGGGTNSMGHLFIMTGCYYSTASTNYNVQAMVVDTGALYTAPASAQVPASRTTTNLGALCYNYSLDYFSSLASEAAYQWGTYGAAASYYAANTNWSRAFWSVSSTGGLTIGGMSSGIAAPGSYLSGGGYGMANMLRVGNGKVVYLLENSSADTLNIAIFAPNSTPGNGTVTTFMTGTAAISISNTYQGMAYVSPVDPDTIYYLTPTTDLNTYQEVPIYIDSVNSGFSVGVSEFVSIPSNGGITTVAGARVPKYPTTNVVPYQLEGYTGTNYLVYGDVLTRKWEISAHRQKGLLIGS